MGLARTTGSRAQSSVSEVDLSPQAPVGSLHVAGPTAVGLEHMGSLGSQTPVLIQRWVNVAEQWTLFEHSSYEKQRLAGYFNLQMGPPVSFGEA